MAFKALTVNTPPAQAAHILAEDDAAIYGGLLGQDCVLPLGQKLKATVISNNKVRIADGVVSVGGHIGRVISGDYEDMTIANGVSGKKRNDIIAARFIAGASGGTDTYKLVVIQGTAGTTARDPVTVKGDLYSGDKQRDYPLWRVKIEGLSIVKVEQMYKVGVSDAELLERMTEMNRSLTEKITEINSSLVQNITHNKITETTYLLDGNKIKRFSTIATIGGEKTKFSLTDLSNAQYIWLDLSQSYLYNVNNKAVYPISYYGDSNSCCYYRIVKSDNPYIEIMTKGDWSGYNAMLSFLFY